MSTLQTLDRGARALFAVAARPGGVTVAELAAELDVARAISYRLVATLEEHGLLTRDSDGRVYLGASIPALAARYWPSLLSMATPVLQELADRTNATAYLSVAERDEAVAVLSLDPSMTSVLRIGYRIGSRHPLDRGAAGIAILSGRPPAPDDSAEVTAARTQGYSITHGHLQPGAVGVAAPLRFAGARAGAPEACVGIVALEDFDAEAAGTLIVEAARRIGGGVPVPQDARPGA
ncbi:IclR family transcriptional regulator [Streptomyces sp. NPDC059894]|uniref:IclR family transcriptional regulator n=1 Tax=unclassified Streptomyces TaxID=2593676 RepID=UPI0036491370